MLDILIHVKMFEPILKHLGVVLLNTLYHADGNHAEK